MIDIHCHLLPEMDDGSSSEEETLKLANQLAAQGVKTCILTPHFYAAKEDPETFLKRRQDAYEKVREGLNALHVDFHLGAEVAFYSGMTSSDITALRLNGTDFLLLEMPFCRWSKKILYEVKTLSEKHKVILAHVERYFEYHKPSSHVWSDLASQGILFQVNAASILDKKLMKQLYPWFLNDKIHFLASDSHNLEERPPLLLEAIERMYQKFDEGDVNTFLRTGEAMFNKHIINPNYSSLLEKEFSSSQTESEISQAAELVTAELGEVGTGKDEEEDGQNDSILLEDYAGKKDNQDSDFKINRMDPACKASSPDHPAEKRSYLQVLRRESGKLGSGFKGSIELTSLKSESTNIIVPNTMMEIVHNDHLKQTENSCSGVIKAYSGQEKQKQAPTTKLSRAERHVLRKKTSSSLESGKRADYVNTDTIQTSGNNRFNQVPDEHKDDYSKVIVNSGEGELLGSDPLDKPLLSEVRKSKTNGMILDSKDTESFGFAGIRVKQVGTHSFSGTSALDLLRDERLGKEDILVDQNVSQSVRSGIMVDKPVDTLKYSDYESSENSLKKTKHSLQKIQIVDFDDSGPETGILNLETSDSGLSVALRLDQVRDQLSANSDLVEKPKPSFDIEDALGQVLNLHSGSEKMNSSSSLDKEAILKESEELARFLFSE